MAQDEQPQSSSARRWVDRALAFFPLLIAFGVLAPGVVQVMAQEAGEQEQEAEETPVLNFPKGAFLGRTPMLPVPREFSAGLVPELVDLEHLFARTGMTGDPLARRLFARMLSFPRGHGDVIVIDDVDRQLMPIVFKDPVMLGTLVAQSAWPPPSPLLSPLLGAGPLGDGLIYDDPIGPFVDNTATNVIPEPGTGVLLGLGLTLLAVVRRSKSL